MLDAVEKALELESQGFVTVPVHSAGPNGDCCSCGEGMKCTKIGKHPIGLDWQDCRNGPERLAELVAKGWRPNVGILPKPSGIVVVDIDPRAQGDEKMKAFVDRYGRLPRTKTNTTGGDGWHYYFKAPEGVELAGKLVTGIDLKSDGMVVAEGSRSGKGEYSVLVDAEPCDLPQWIIDEARKPTYERQEAPEPAPAAAVDPNDPDLPRRQAYCTSAIASEIAKLDAMEAAKVKGWSEDDSNGYQGENWNQTVFDVACNIFEFANTPEAGLSAEEAIDLILDHAPRDENFGDAEVLTRIESARDRVGSTGRTIPAPPINPFGGAVAVAVDDDDDGGHLGGVSPDDQHSGQVRMAYRLQQTHSEKLMHVYGMGWYFWAGTHWELDKEGRTTRAVIETIKDALIESVGSPDGKKLRSDAAKCESAAGIAGVLAVASALPEFAATVEQLDANPYYLNVANGTFDFSTGELREHDPKDRITSITKGAYRPGEAGSGAWSDFLESIMPNAEERAFLQRVVGQALLGVVREHLFPVLTGTGSNGKSTFYEALVAALGSYAIVIDPSLLMAQDRRRSGGPEMLRLLGTRIAVGSETGENQKLDESVMKRLSGGDSLEARNLYKPPVEWVPSHQILYVTNHLPKVHGDDPAVWRRIRVIPFDVVIPDEKKDVTLKDRLILDADAILSWAIEGYFDYRDGGMRAPESVTRATSDYQQKSDVMSRFVSDECLVSPAATATTRELFSAWERWSRTDEDARLMSEKAFSTELKRLGYTSKRTARGNLWQGIAPLVSTEGGL